MTRIDRPTAAPSRLQRGIAEVTAMELRVKKRPKVAGTERDPFTFDQTIYGHSTVKVALKRAQNNKCAFCENDFSGNASGDVEHFRPKGFSQQASGSAKMYPGYYWLAYSWANLLYSCEHCNRRIKRNLFPLKNPGHRARHSRDDLSTERPMLIDPSGPDDPRDHIGFRYNKPYGKTDRGLATIHAMALDRTELDNPRLDRIKYVKALQTIAGLDPADPQHDVDLVQAIHDARATLPSLVKPNAVFSAMTADFLGV